MVKIKNILNHHLENVLCSAKATPLRFCKFNASRLSCAGKLVPWHHPIKLQVLENPLFFWGLGRKFTHTERFWVFLIWSWKWIDLNMERALTAQLAGYLFVDERAVILQRLLSLKIVHMPTLFVELLFFWRKVCLHHGDRGRFPLCKMSHWR